MRIVTKKRFKIWQHFNASKLCNHSDKAHAVLLVCSTNPYIHLVVPPSVTREYYLRYVNFSTCCSVWLLTWSTHWLSFLERHDTSVFSVLIFIPASSQAAANQSGACWRPCSEDASSTKASAECKRLILQLPKVTSSLTRLWLSIQFIWTKRSGESTLLLEFNPNGCDLTSSTRTQRMSRSAVTWRPVTGGVWHRPPAILQSFYRGARSYAFSRSTKHA